MRAFLALTFLLLVGCDNNAITGEGPETENTNFRQAMTYQQQGDARRALECYLKVIDARAEAPEAHLETGRLYLELKEPLPAIYHFKQSVRLKPKPDQRANAVAQLVRTAEKLYLQQIPGQPFDSDGTLISLDASQRISQLQAENNRLKRELEELYRKGRSGETPSSGTAFGGFPSNSSNSTASAPIANLPGGARTYTVVAGDNLYSISRKMYGTANRANDIQKANTGVLNGGVSLKVGMTLVIPK